MKRHFILALAVLMIALPLSALGAYGPEAISTGHEEETPSVVVDLDGNAHIVWASVDDGNLFYKMVDKDGNVLIEETNLNPCVECDDQSHVRRPSIALDSAGELHIVFHGFSLHTDFGDPEESAYNDSTDLDASEVIYTKINPYLDDRNGDSADLAAIMVIEETIISTDDGTKSRAPNIALDPTGDRLHVVWFDGPAMWDNGSDLQIHYGVMDLEGAFLTPESTLTEGLIIDVDWGEPEIAVDLNGNAHIVYCTVTTEEWDDDDREIFYTMVDSKANTLIDDIDITEADGSASVRPKLAIDSQNMVHVVWHDKRLYDAETGEHEIFYSKLDPAQEIAVISEQRISSDNGEKSNQKNIAIDECDRIHVTWADGDEWGGMSAANGDGEGWRYIYYAMFTSSGDTLDTVIPEEKVTGEDIWPSYWWWSSTRDPSIAIAGGSVFITFNAYWEDVEGDGSDIYLSILDVEACPQIEALAINPSGAGGSCGGCFINTASHGSMMGVAFVFVLGLIAAAFVAVLTIRRNV